MNTDNALSNPEKDRQTFVQRMIVASFFIALFMLVIISRYFDLQINQYQDFVTQADNNRVHMRPAAPARGIIYDRNGEILADNRSISTLTIIRERTEDLDTLICLLYTSPSPRD